MTKSTHVVHLFGGDAADHHLRMRRKILLLISEFGAQLLETPVPELKRMADMSCSDPDKNLFLEIWDRHHFVPTAGLLHEIGGEDIPGLSPFILLLEQIWEAATPDRKFFPFSALSQSNQGRLTSEVSS